MLPARKPHSVIARVVQAVAVQFDALGADGTATLAAFGLPLAGDPNAWLPFDSVSRWGDALVRASGNADLGLRVGQQVPFGSRPLLDNLFASAPTLGHALGVVDRFAHLASDVMTFRRAEDVASRVRYELVVSDALVPSRWVLDLIMARSMADLRYVMRQHFRPLEVCFCYGKPGDTSEHRRVFGAPVQFGKQACAITCSSRMLDLPMPGANSSLHELLEEIAARSAREFQALGTQTTVSQRVRSYIAGDLSKGVSQAAAARRLGMSDRSLRRRLGEENTTFQGEVTAVRKEMAEQYLRRADLSISDVSYVLGFTSPNAFHRAFKRWTGLTPSVFRERSR